MKKMTEAGARLKDMLAAASVGEDMPPKTSPENGVDSDWPPSHRRDHALLEKEQMREVGGGTMLSCEQLPLRPLLENPTTHIPWAGSSARVCSVRACFGIKRFGLQRSTRAVPTNAPSCLDWKC
ncbi:unnamed protein product [Linum trigynum]|uniref:Uncharacterized protein n=1 Tax=Linum trigynum TaxID=586398 RepID=A0AAV2ERI0_9ROSI